MRYLVLGGYFQIIIVVAVIERDNLTLVAVVAGNVQTFFVGINLVNGLVAVKKRVARVERFEIETAFTVGNSAVFGRAAEFKYARINGFCAFYSVYLHRFFLEYRVVFQRNVNALSV